MEDFKIESKTYKIFGKFKTCDLLVDFEKLGLDKKDLDFAKGNFETIEDIIKYLAEKNPNSEAINYSFLWAVCNKKRELSKFLLDRGAYVNYAAGAAIRCAVLSSSADPKMVKLLLENGADPNAGSNEALRNASTYCSKAKIVKLLLESGADPNACGEVGDDTAYLGCSLSNATVNNFGNEDTTIISMLLDYGADIHNWDEEALTSSAFHGNTKIVEYLLDRGADIHACRDEALFNAIYHSHSDTIKVLLERGGDMHARYDSELVSHVERLGADTIKLLIDNGADIFVRNSEQLKKCIENKKYYNAKILTENGAKLDFFVEPATLEKIRTAVPPVHVECDYH